MTNLLNKIKYTLKQLELYAIKDPLDPSSLASTQIKRIFYQSTMVFNQLNIWAINELSWEEFQ